MFKVNEKFRNTTNPILKSDSSFGNNGLFQIPLSDRSIAYVIASDGANWEHLSVHIVSNGKPTTPTWNQMCKIKGLFWDEDDCVVQYHPPKCDYVNNHKHTLHLWRPTVDIMPKPDSILVGFK